MGDDTVDGGFDLVDLRQFVRLARTIDRPRDIGVSLEQIAAAESAIAASLSVSVAARDVESRRDALLELRRHIDSKTVIDGVQSGRQLADLRRIARTDPETLQPLFERRPSLNRLSGQAIFEAVCPAVARREPGVLKPVIPALISLAETEPAATQTLFWLADTEPALVRRELANACWTIDQGIEQSTDSPAALQSVGCIAAVAPGLVPDDDRYLTATRQLEGRGAVAAADAVHTVLRARRWQDEVLPARAAVLEWQTELLSVDDWRCRQRAARLLGSVPLDEPTAAIALDTLVRRLPDDDPDVREAILGSIADIVAETPSLRTTETVERVAVFLDRSPVARRVIRCHGKIALDALGVDPIAVSLGADRERVRHEAIETLLSLGMGAPVYREELFRALCWALHDPDSAVRRHAIEAIGVAGRLWPSVAPAALDQLREQLRLHPAEATCVAEAIVDLSRTYPDVGKDVAEHLVGDTVTATEPAAVDALSVIAVECPDVGVAFSEQLLELATEPEQTAAAEALLELVKRDSDRVTVHTERLQTALERQGLPPEQWAAIATIWGLTADSGEVPQAEWLRKRFPEYPLVFGPALATLTAEAPAVTLPPLEGLFATVQRFGRESSLDPDRILDDVVTPLVGTHPIAGEPIVSTLCSILEGDDITVESTTRRRTLALLDSALEEWPYFAPMAQTAIDRCLESGDDALLSQLPEVISRWQLTEADETLDVLGQHPSVTVRAATRRARRSESAQSMPEADVITDESSGDDGSPIDVTDADRDVTDADTDTVDSVARQLSPHGDDRAQAALETLGQIGSQQPSLRDRCLVHVLGYIAGTGRTDDAVSSVLSMLAPETPMVDGLSPASATDQATMVSQLLGIAETAAPIASAQALSTAGIVVQAGLSELAPAVVEQAGDSLDRSSQLVTSRALVTLRRLATYTPQRVSPQQLEPSLFRPHAVVPTAAWTLGAVAVRQPEAAETVAESLPGLCEWSVLDRQHAAETMTQLLAADPGLDTLYAPTLLDRLAADGHEASSALLTQIGLLSAETIVETHGGTAALVSYLYDSEGEGDEYLNESDGHRKRPLVADRLYRVAAIAPEQVRRAIGDASLLPRIHDDDAHYLLATWLRLVRDDHTRVDVPCIDAMAVLDTDFETISVTETYDTVMKRGADLTATTSTLEGMGLELLARTGHGTFPAALDDHRDGTPLRSPTPELVVTFLLRCEFDSSRQEMIDYLSAHAPLSLRHGVVERLTERLDTAPPDRRARIIEHLAELVAGLTDPPLIDGAVDAVPEALADEWTVRLAAVDAVPEALADEWTVRLAAVDAVGTLGESGAVSRSWAIDRLLETLSDGDPAVRTNAADALARLCLDTVLEIEPVVDELCEAVMSGTELGHRGRVAALGRIGTAEPSVRDRICRVVSETLDADDPTLRQRSLEAMSDLADAEATLVSTYLPEIGARVEDPEKPVQQAAIECLGAVGASDSTETVCRFLSEMLAHDDTDIRRDTVKTLYVLSRSAPEGVADYSEQIRRLLPGAPADESIAIIECLERIATTTEYEGVPGEVPSVLRRDRSLRATQDEIWTALVETVDRDNRRVSRRAMEALASVAEDNPTLVVSHLDEVVDDYESYPVHIRSTLDECIYTAATESDDVKTVYPALLQLFPMLDTEHQSELTDVLHECATRQPATAAEHAVRLATLVRTVEPARQADCLRCLFPPASDPAFRSDIVPQLVALSGLDNTQVRHDCLEQLADVASADPELVSAFRSELRDRLDDAAATVRAQAVRLLSLVGSRRDWETIRTLSKSTSIERPIGTEARYRFQHRFADESEVTLTDGVSVFRYDSARTGSRSTGATAVDSLDWKTDLEYPVVSSPITGSGSVFVCSYGSGNQYALEGLDPASGEIRYRYTHNITGLGDLFGDGGFGPVSTPMVTPGSIYTASHKLTIDAGGIQEDRELRSAVSESAPVAVGGTVYLGIESTIQARYCGDLAVRWVFETDEPVISSPAIADGTVFVGSGDGALYALDAAVGTKQWSVQTGGAIESTPAVVDGTVYIGSTDGIVYAVDAADGTIDWSVETADEIRASPAVTEDVVVVGSFDGTLYVLDADDGSTHTQQTVGSGIYASPTIVGDTIYVGCTDGRLLAVDSDDGRSIWEYEIDAGISSAPTVTDEAVYVGDTDGTVYKFH